MQVIVKDERKSQAGVSTTTFGAIPIGYLFELNGHVWRKLGSNWCERLTGDYAPQFSVTVGTTTPCTLCSGVRLEMVIKNA